MEHSYEKYLYGFPRLAFLAITTARAPNAILSTARSSPATIKGIPPAFGKVVSIIVSANRE